MPHTDDSVLHTMRSWEDAVEQIRFLVLQISSKSICAKIRNLHHAGESAIHE